MLDAPLPIKDAFAHAKHKLRSNLWALLHVLYPPPKYYWSPEVHGPVCDYFVQKDASRSVADQDERKQRLFLDPRNHFKTTIDVCDAVQWILNFPDIRLLLASGVRDHAVKMAGSVKSHFQYNPVIRELFPEFCPLPRKVEDFGTSDHFTCPARTDRSLREPTVSVASPDSTVAGMHYEVLKFDDLVNETNSRTQEGLAQVTTWYKLTGPLLEPWGYRDVIGTRYDFSDTYGSVLGDDPEAGHILGRLINDYLVFRRTCYKPDGSPLFPERFTKERLERERRELGTFLFSCQYLNEPVPSDSQHFPLPLVQGAFLGPRRLPKQRVRYMTLDMALSQSSDADRTAIVTCSVGAHETEKHPKIYIEHVAAGHFKPLETVQRLFTLYKKYRPLTIAVEDTGFQRLLKPIVDTEARRQNVFLPFKWIKRDTQEAKQTRIAALQAWFERGDIKILDTIDHKEELILELTRFPRYRRDDIIDALADQLQNANYLTIPDPMPLPELTHRSGDPMIGLL